MNRALYFHKLGSIYCANVEGYELETSGVESLVSKNRAPQDSGVHLSLSGWGFICAPEFVQEILHESLG